MKTDILLSAIVAATLPALSFAQEPANNAAGSANEKAVAERAAAEKAALDKVRETTTTTTTERTSIDSSVTAPANTPAVGIAALDGITISGTTPMLTRNGVMTKLTETIELSNGLKMSPDGTFTTPQGATMTLRPTQRITLDGRLVDSPVRETVTPQSIQPVTPRAGEGNVQVPTGRGAGNQATVTGNVQNPAPRLGADGGAK